MISNLLRLDGEMVDTQVSKSCAAKRGGSSPLQGIVFYLK